MFTDHRDSSSMLQALRWTLCLLALVSLVACGASEQGGGAPQPESIQVTAGATQPSTAILPTAAPAAQPTSPSIVQATATSQLVRPTVGPRPSPIPQPPRSLRPTATPLVVPTVPPANTTAPVAGAWQTYRNAQAGFRIDYPSNWVVSELLDEAGASITAFMPAGGGPGISVAVQVGGPPAIEPPEQETRRCERVVIARLTGTRCLNMATSTISTTLVGKDRTYIIATTDKGIDGSLYQHMLDSFVPIG
jgi:hypothetical protein